MKLNINLATRIYVNFRQVNFFLALAFLLCFSWLAVNLYLYASSYDETNRYAEYKRKSSAGGTGKAVTDAEYSRFLVKVNTVNTILQKRSYNWLSLLESLEQHVPSGVSLRSLEPSNKGETLKLSGTAVDFPAIRKFVENLESSKTFTEIYLTDQSNVRIDAKRKAVNFTITCKAAIS